MISKIAYQFYRFKKLRPFILSLIRKLEKGDFYSVTLRKIFCDYHQIVIGMYSYGCFNPNCINAYTQIGRYCSFAEGVCIFNGNHPLNYQSLHPFFYNPKLRYVKEEKIVRRHIEIGHDVWVGRNAIITPSVTNIGNGAVIGAGAVVTKDVPDFAVVVGNPARVIKYRFEPETIDAMNRSQWWLKDIEELVNDMDAFTRPFNHVCTW
jgi:acetyltransferase-like isoleucine patch superfamily enzyme